MLSYPLHSSKNHYDIVITMTNEGYGKKRCELKVKVTGEGCDEINRYF